MKSVSIVDKSIIDGRLISITIKINDPNERAIFMKFLEGEETFKKCPKCGHSNTVGEDDMCMRIDSPLASNQLLAASTPIMHCDHCGELIDLSMMDYTCFPSVISFLSKLKASYNKMKKEKKDNG